MESVLHKTMHSLETALRYNPASVELMASLAEVYIRLGRFDRRTMELCEQVLARQGDNLLLAQAQSIGALIEQSQQVEEALRYGDPPPELAALQASLKALSEFLAQTVDCADAWLAWTRFQILAGQLDRALKGLSTLQKMEVADLSRSLQSSLFWTVRRTDLDAAQYRCLTDLFGLLGLAPHAVKQFEALFDGGCREAGSALLELYLQRFTPNRLDEVPDASRERLFTLLLDYADRETTGVWLRKATLMGWEVSAVSRSYARSLIGEGLLEDAFAVLQRLPIDPQVKELLNDISLEYERKDELDKAVAVLRYINDHELSDADLERMKEAELAREAELSMAELQLKSGRVHEALHKFISALCLSPQVEPAILERIDEILETSSTADPEAILRLSFYFRRIEDRPKALFYLNHGLEMNPDNQEILAELENLFEDILRENPDMAHLRLELAELHLRTGRTDLALARLREAAASPSLTPRGAHQLAELLVKAGHLEDALEKFRSLRIEEEDFEPLYTLHEEFMQRESWREALMALDLIAKVNPGYRDIAEKIRLLEERTGKSQPEIQVDPKMRELIGDLAIGRYQYLDRLGSGGMGVVYKVYDIRNQQTVAMKILRDSLSGSSKALDRFFREARIAATIRHRNIINIYDYNISNMSGQSYIVMEYVDGPSLREIIDRQFQQTMEAPLDYITEVLYYGIQLCDALEAAHAKGIVHRDIKPDNIMINTQCEVKITDFGIVHVEEATFTPTGAMLGTPRYMSPEQVTGGKIDGRSDIYSVGIVLYEALAGSPPFMTGDVAYQQLHNSPVPPREINPLIPQGVAEVIMKCLEKKPDERYVNAHALKADLAQQLANLGGCARFEAQTCIDEGGDQGGLGLDDELDLD